MKIYTIREAVESDRTKVADIFNYYIENSFAAFPDKKVGPDIFDTLKSMCIKGFFYMLETPPQNVVGFGLIRRHQFADAFKYSAEITYFILPQHQRSGAGSILLNRLIADARKSGIESLLANISSLNEQSLNFHKKNGFIECGRFINTGRKFGRYFDEVWMQKFIIG